MLSSVLSAPQSPVAFVGSVERPGPACGAPAHLPGARHITDALDLVNEALAPARRMVRAGDHLYRAGQRFENLFVLNSGVAKIVKLSPDGRDQVVGLKFRGDWLGFDGIAEGQYTCDAVAIDTGEVWVIGYDTLMSNCVRVPALLTTLHAAMSREMSRDRESMLSMCTLPADARVADFLRNWADALSMRGLRTDQITLRMTRAEIGNYLGMTIETVSRVFSRLAREKLIVFAEKGRREVRIPDVGALAVFVQRCVSPLPSTLQ
jgi:CRP/FNR family transcriptional regulator